MKYVIIGIFVGIFVFVIFPELVWCSFDISCFIRSIELNLVDFPPSSRFILILSFVVGGVFGGIIGSIVEDGKK